ncbi:conserved exported hypothetical protein [Candidatus Sulfotelmatobacter sp. SbA7]|nr:conserved exported hypothetical protein [Candidatus Sulfotelmatobacter sp. SbA7]
MNTSKRVWQNFAVVLLFAVASSTVANAQGALKTIDNPKGGRIIYGQVDGQSTEAGAMGAVLRSLHNQYGDKPQVGKLFQVRGTNSVAAFFTMVNRNQGNMHLAGMLIACSTSGNRVEAALMTDEAARFGSTINPMLSKLFSVWRPNGNAPSSQPAGAVDKAAALKLYTLPDRSASVSLPEGWNVLPASGGGTVMAQGPDGSAVALGYPYLASDTNNPSVRQTMATLQRGGLRNTSYAHALYYPYGGDLGRTFEDLLQMARKNQGEAPVAIKISSETAMPVSGALRCAHLHGQIDAQDGKGMREMNTVFCSSPPGPHGSYMNLAYHTAVPLRFADQERGTMEAILASFNVNQAIVQSQANAIAAPAIAAIHQIGRQAAQQAADAHAAEDAHNAAVEKRWDAQDKSNQAFSNYLLDQTVIQDNQLNAHGTVWNQTADAMVKNDPQRYEYVNTPNFWKGIDY